MPVQERPRIKAGGWLQNQATKVCDLFANFGKGHEAGARLICTAAGSDQSSALFGLRLSTDRDAMWSWRETRLG